LLDLPAAFLALLETEPELALLAVEAFFDKAGLPAGSAADVSTQSNGDTRNDRHTRYQSIPH